MIGFVADEHIPLLSIRLLRESGYRVISIRDEYPSIDDELILRLAQDENLIIITNDTDFGDLIFRDRVPFSAGLIYLRLNRFQPGEIAELILHHMNEFGVEFAGKVTVISRIKLRQRDL